MKKFFNTAGPCRPDRHYMLPPERRLPAVRGLIEQEQYFVVHAPRQVGKTTCFRTLARHLNEEGHHVALLASCEAAQAAGSDVERGIAALLDALRQAAVTHLPPALHPPAGDPSVPAETRLQDVLARWARQAPRPLVLFLDEVDSLLDRVLISVLRQLRSGYADRPGHFPQTVALLGLRDVRDYRLDVRPEPQSLGTASPFNIKVESLTLRNFTGEEVAELYAQHTQATGQVFEQAAARRAFELTGGHPWLVNALARQAVEKLAPDPGTPITLATLERAKEDLINRRDTHLDSLVDRLREPRVRRVLDPLLAGEILAPDVLDDDLQLVQDLGLVVAGPQGLTIANPIYREVIPRALTGVLEASVTLPSPTYVDPQGRLDFQQVLYDFREFWVENAESFLARSPYSEAAAQLVFMAFLHKVVNGGGFVDREYAVGAGRLDLCVRWPHPRGLDRHAVELKVWRTDRLDPIWAGLEQLSRYLDRLNLPEGTLLIFDARDVALPLPDRCEEEEHQHGGHAIRVLRL